MKSTVSIFLSLLLTVSVYAQQDYIVTEQRDTLFGFVRHNFAWFGNRIALYGKERKTKFLYKDIIAYRMDGSKYMKAKAVDKKGREQTWHCRVVVDGLLTLLEETVRDGPAHFLYFKDTFYRIDRQHFPRKIWEQLLHCPTFGRRYAADYRYEGGTVISFPRHQKIWIEMVRYYNDFCKTLTFN